MRVHIIHPAGFAFSPKALRRGGLDYVERADFEEHSDFTAFESWRRAAGRRLVLLTTGARTSVHAATYGPGDILMLGRETAGVPAPVAAAAELHVRIPMRQGLRSLNVATAAALVLGEALRQTGGFAQLP